MSRIKTFLANEKRLLTAIAVLVVLLNIPYGRYALYPFMLFSTWVHEMCHGVAALLIGGGVDKLEVYPDGSGLCFTRYGAGAFTRAWVASAGYMGTSVIGALTLVFRRRPLAGRIGVTAFGVLMLVSTVLFVRNLFGLVMVPLIGAALAAAGVKLKEELSGWLFSFVAATCCLNAVTSIQVLFGSNLVVNGAPSGGSDAHSVADALLLPYWFWASLWLVTSVALMLVALRFTLPGKSVAAALGAGAGGAAGAAPAKAKASAGAGAA
ncbi:MAG TPA: M50 family metallopeptidase [Myxococcota bacterium]|jgi:hypothetical protein|nr:M50 family metallopeptidase [Myxococcota bacterium]